MKKFKKIATFCLAALFTFGVATLAASCGKDKDNNNSSTAYSKECYTFIIKDANGNAMAGVNVQLCDTENNGACDMPKASDANGIVEYTPVWGEGEFDIHLWNTAMSSEYTFTGAEKTPATYAEIVLTVSAN